MATYRIEGGRVKTAAKPQTGGAKPSVGGDEKVHREQVPAAVKAESRWHGRTKRSKFLNKGLRR